MADSKAYLSFGLLFAFLISSQVLAHELRETSPKDQHSYNDEGNNFKHPTSQDLEMYRRSGSSMHSFRHRTGPGYKTPRLEDVEESIRADNAEADNSVFELEDSTSDWTYPRTPRKTTRGTGGGHYTQPSGYNPSNLEDIEPENYEGGSVMMRRRYMKPSEIDSRTFPAFPGKTPRMRYGSKTDGVPRMEDVDEAN